MRDGDGWMSSRLTGRRRAYKGSQMQTLEHSYILMEKK